MSVSLRLVSFIKASLLLLLIIGSSLAEQFSCPSNGIFPDPNSCDKFYSCSNGLGHKMSCPGGTLFNRKLNLCDHSRNVRCHLGSALDENILSNLTFASASVTEDLWQPRVSSQPEVTFTYTFPLFSILSKTAGDIGMQSNFSRGCYFTNWAQYRPGNGKYIPKNYVDGLCDYIFFAFATLNHKFELANYEWNDLDKLYPEVTRLKLFDPNLKTLLSLGGWTFGTERFKRLSESAEKRKAFIQSAIIYLRKYNFDGLDVDWEYPDNDQDKVNMVILFKEIREVFNRESLITNRPRLLLTAAVSAAAEKVDVGYDVPSLAKELDFINVMSYDFHGAWETTTGMNSPLFRRSDDKEKFAKWNIADSAQHWVDKGMPKKKIFIGLAAYGRGWTLQNKDDVRSGALATGPSNALLYTREGGVASYYECCELLSKGAQRYWDNETKTPYLVHQNQWISYDDAESFAHKIDWIIKNDFAGAFVWTLDMDDFPGTFCQQFHSGLRYPLISAMQKLKQF